MKHYCASQHQALDLKRTNYEGLIPTQMSVMPIYIMDSQSVVKQRT